VNQGNIGIVVFMPLKLKSKMTGGFPVLKPLEQRVWVPRVVLPVRTFDHIETLADQRPCKRFGLVPMEMRDLPT